MSTDEVSIDFTTEEILVLAELLELEPPPGIGVDSLSDLAIANNEALLRGAATRSLQDRNVLVGDSVVQSVRDVMGALCAPGVMAAGSIERDGVVETRFFASLPDISIEHRGLSVSLHRLVPFATRDLLPRLLQFADLRPFSPDTEVSFRVSEEVLDLAADALDAQQHARAQEILQAGGVEADASVAFIRALSMKRTSTSVTVLSKPADDQVEGGALTWIDAGLAGLWTTEISLENEGVAVDHDVLVISLSSAEQVATELLSYLPDAFGEFGIAL